MKRILIYRWHSYNDLDVEQAFMNSGYAVDYVERTEKTYTKDEKFEDRIRAMVKEEQYEFFFTMNYFPAIANLCKELELRYISWTCDSPLIGMYDQSVFLDTNYIFTFDKSNYLEFKGRGVKHIYHLPLAANVKRMEQVLAGYPEECYTDDISFVGSLYSDRNSYDKIKETLPDYLKGYFDGVMQARLCVPDNQIMDAMLTPAVLEKLEESYKLEKSEESFSDLSLIFSTTVLGFKIASKQRRNALIALSKAHEVAVYNKELTKDLLRVNYKGPVDYWKIMPLVFRGSKVNLNFTIPNIQTGIPLRVWDVLGSGGFLLSNFQAEIPDYFGNGKDLVCFFDETDLQKKVEYYLTHEAERINIAQCGYQKVKQYHTYEHRIVRMLKILEADTDK